MRQKSQKPTKAPVSIPKLTRSNTMDDEDEDDEDDEDDGAEAGAKPGGGSLLPRKRFPANTAISITIERIQIKEPESFIEPYFTVSIHGTHAVWWRGCGGFRSLREYFYQVLQHQR